MPGPKEDDIERAVKLIDESKRPAIIAGWGTRHCGDTLLKFADKVKAPIATTSRAKGVVNEKHSLSLGVLGSLGSKHAAQSIQSADLVIVIGTGFRHAHLVPAGIKMIQIDWDPTRIGRTFDIHVGIVGDAGMVLERLIPKAATKKPDGEFWQTIQKMKAAHAKEIETEAEDSSRPISPGFVIQALKRNTAKNAIICVDVGDHTYWFYKKFICEGQRTFLSANIASMGFGLPAALSAKLDYPDRQVICLAGDGGFAMLASDFTTAVREKLAIKAIVFNDGRLKNIEKEQLRDGYPMFGVNFPNPDFAKFAISCGGDGFRVEDPKALDATLKQAFASPKPCIVDIVVDPEKLAPSGKRLD
jgi:pyruvate oxidase